MCIYLFVYLYYFDNLKIQGAALSRWFHLIIAPQCGEAMCLIVFCISISLISFDCVVLYISIDVYISHYSFVYQM